MNQSIPLFKPNKLIRNKVATGYLILENITLQDDLGRALESKKNTTPNKKK
jgi:hypothetical protein